MIHSPNYLPRLVVPVFSHIFLLYNIMSIQSTPTTRPRQFVPLLIQTGQGPV